MTSNQNNEIIRLEQEIEQLASAIKALVNIPDAQIPLQAALAEKETALASIRASLQSKVQMPISSDVRPRGALKLEISTSTPIVSAGKEFSIYVIIRNPFPVPVAIYRTETHIPVELDDQIWAQIEEKRELLERKNQISNLTNSFKSSMLWFTFRLSDMYRSIYPASSPRIAVAVGPETQNDYQVPRHITNINSVTSDRDLNILGEQWNLNFATMSPDEVRQILWDIEEYRKGTKPFILNPGDSIVRHFILKANNWLTFTPISFTFQIQVNYSVDSHIHVDTVPYALNIRAASTSSLIGAAIGSILGSIVNPRNVQSADLIQNLFISLIFAIIIVVAFARKSNVQQIVSVEDIWGGIFIGFLVGYSGETFVNSVLGLPK